eukprot:6299808-Prymnesium_polylepis.1
MGAWFDCCNNTGLSHRQSNLGCSVSIALLARRNLIVEQLTEAQKHTRCEAELTLDWASFYDFGAIQAELGVAVHLEPRGLTGTSALPFKPRSLLAPLRGANGTLVEVVDSVPRAVASRAVLV